MKHAFRPIFLTVVAFLSISLGFAQVISKPHNNTAKFVLTSRENGLEPEEEFACSGRIHGYLTLPDVVQGEHLLEGVWTMPNGAVNQHAKIPLEFAPPGRQTAYVWFEFDQQSGGLLSGIREPASNEVANRPYTGEWEVEVRWDNKVLTKKNFKVKC